MQPFRAADYLTSRRSAATKKPPGAQQPPELSGARAAGVGLPASAFAAEDPRDPPAVRCADRQNPRCGVLFRGISQLQRLALNCALASSKLATVSEPASYWPTTTPSYVMRSRLTLGRSVCTGAGR